MQLDSAETINIGTVFVVNINFTSFKAIPNVSLACLPRWKVDLFTKKGQCILVKHVLKSLMVYFAMAIDLPPWAIKAIDKFRRGILWRRKEEKGGHNLMA